MNWLNVMVVVRLVVVLVNCIKLGLGKVMLWLVCVVSFGGVNCRCCMLASVCSICVVISCMVWCVGCDIGCFVFRVAFRSFGVIWCGSVMVWCCGLRPSFPHAHSGVLSLWKWVKKVL